MTDDTALDALLMRSARSAPTATGACPPEAQLEAHAFERLAGAEADQVQHHLTTCPACRAYWVGLRTPVAAAVLDRMAAAAPRPVRWPLWAGLGTVAAAAAAVFFLTFRGVAPPPPYTLDGPWGGVKALRADTEAASQVFLPHSRLVVSLKPQAALKGAPPVASLYVAAGDGPLQARPARLLQPGEGGVFVLEAPASELFGTTAGRYTLHLVLEAGPPPDRAGQAPAPARAAAEAATWLEIPIDYRLEAP